MQKIIEKLKFVDDMLEYMQLDPQSLSRTTLAEVIGELQQLLNKHDVSGSLPPVISPNDVQKNYWTNVCHTVVTDAMFEQKNIADTIEYLMSMYNIELKLGGNDR